MGLKTEVKLADYVFNYLKNIGVNDIFMLSGGGCMHLCDSLGRSGINYICCLHEQAASIAALAYSQYKNDLGVALVTTGPGSTNALTGVAGAWAESAPLMIISGQVKTADISGKSGVRMLGFQEAPTVDIVKPVTKYSVTVTDPLKIKYHLDKAVYIAKTGRPGPVWIDIPLDVQAVKIHPVKLESFKPVKKPARSLQQEARKILSMIEKSQRPVIMAGYGIRLSGAANDFLKLVKMLGIPVLTTWKGADLLTNDNAYFFGRPGTAGQRGANFILQNSDLLISLGARLDFGQIGYEHETFAREAKKVIVDIDPAELGKFRFNVDMPVNADCGDLIKGMISLKPSLKKCKGWLAYCARVNKEYPVLLEEYGKKKKYVSTYALAGEISNKMKSGDIFVPGSSGMCSDIPMQVFKFKKDQRSLNSPGIGSMGFGVPSALGACVASGKKRVVCTNGDGGFQMNIQELETIRRLNLPVKFFVLNNDGYASIKTTQRNYFGGFYVGSNSTSGVTLPDTIKIANAYGFKAFYLDKTSSIKQTVKKVLESKGPAICEVMIDPMEIVSPKVSSAVGVDGKMFSKPLEDLFPFLSRPEFLRNMIIRPLKEN
ncbi:MAG: thiamine pyrophosphate-binding protein [Smithella sp.]|jgi:acetolactate synthase-1/2/3 large subunit